MKRKLGILFMCLGTALLVLALSLFFYNMEEAQEAQRATVNLLPQLVQQIEADADDIEGEEETRPVIIPGTPLDLLDPSVFEMTEVEIDGHKYIGYLAIPDLGLELPVMSEWSYEKLRIAPCRYTGTVLSEDLVLMAHNYATHFGQLQKLPIGAQISFTDMDGVTTLYEVIAIEVLTPTAVEDMTAGEFDLTLFTCTYGGQSRVTVRCDQIKN